MTECDMLPGLVAIFRLAHVKLAAFPVYLGGRHIKTWSNSVDAKGAVVVKLRLRDGEKIQDAVKRFRKLVEHAGIKKEMRRREYYEKPSDSARRARRRAERRARLNRLH